MTIATLIDRSMPHVTFSATTGESTIDLASRELGDYVLFIYPRTGRPDRPEPAEWSAVPGAKGCTAESCEFRDLIGGFRALNFSVFGLSSQDTDYQREAAARLHLPYPLLSDPDFRLADELGLGTFVFHGVRLYSRTTLVVRGGRITEAHLDIADPKEHPHQLLDHLKHGAEHTVER
ncbi:peroxiredoxin [Agromyces atrinae]|uniref:peroxiredoxin n=1 Tax=Agromyces atrinae TaxID=592376 RepID=UPI001F58B2F8|nr:peroxiredoxin [Agromyces atrinae]MCI2956237.1 peroxiredoxin [Agromyces atrinae]